jgi:hypothetical protein
MTTGQVGEKLEEALVDLCREDGFLLENGLRKRTLCFRLAHYLVPIFKGYDVDCEYNRFHDPKSEEYVFKRLYPSNNLLVIEAKRVSSEIKDRFDI